MKKSNNKQTESNEIHPPSLRPLQTHQLCGNDNSRKQALLQMLLLVTLSQMLICANAKSNEIK